MLELKVVGDAHPKTFVLVTDDESGELARFQEIVEEWELDEDDPLRALFDPEIHPAEEFVAGVQVPADRVGEMEELLEADWPEVAYVITEQREQAMAEPPPSMPEPS